MAACGLGLLATAVYASDPPHVTGHLGPENPFMAPGGTGTQHGDMQASDVTPFAGPGTGPVTITTTPFTSPFFGRPCGTILFDPEGDLLAFCFGTGSGGNIVMMDPITLMPKASIATPPTGQFGLYMYLDHEDRVVMGAGDRHLRRIAHQEVGGVWSLSVVDDWDLSSHIPNTNPCTTPTTDPTCDYIASVGPDWEGNIWFSTAKGVIGTLNPATGVAKSIRLPAGESVGNSLSSSPEGVAIVSTHALYFLEAAADGTPTILWRETYDRGTSAKPGQLVHGSGTTPTFFGAGGDKYLAITDNADSQVNMLVYKVHKSNPQLLCSTPIFSPGASAVEPSPIGFGQSLFVTNTYGHSFVNPAPVATPGGMQRIDVNGNRCDIVWTNPLKHAVLPKMSAVDKNIYTVERSVTTVNGAPSFRYDWTVIDARTGAVLYQQFIGNAFINDPFVLTPTFSHDGAFYQGVVAGIQRFARQ